VQRVALVAVIGARALAESGVASFGSVLVVLRDGGFELLRIDAGLLGEFGQRRAALEIAGADIFPDRHRKRRHAAEPVFAKRAVVANQERSDLLAGLRRLHHVLNKIVVGIAFVGEASAFARHGDYARLGAV